MDETDKPIHTTDTRRSDKGHERRYERVPEELKAYAHWVNWRMDEDGRKVPVNPRTQGNAGVTFENTWSSFPVAVNTGAKANLGIGFVLTKADPYTCIDLDKVVAADGVDPDAQEVVELMQGYVELSPSGDGLHIWVKCREVINRRTKGLEIYSSQRWMTVTGRSNPAAPRIIPERTAELMQVVDRHFSQPPTRLTPSREVIVDDTELWERLFKSKNGSFVQSLYRGDLSVVGGDHSRGVIMLANLLAVFTDGDGARMSRMLQQTGLVNDKWFERRGQGTWLEYQIGDAIGYALNRGRRT